MNIYEKIGFKPADILLPHNIDLSRWSVVACDQYTSQPDYWKEVENNVGDSPSALNITFPEIYLKDDNSERIEKINNTMNDYLARNLFKEYKDSLIYVERVIGGGRIRPGIIGAVDLEAYDFSADSKTLIRATEGTVTSRIPPRVNIRIDAPLELPHIMILIDDEDKNIIEKIEKDNLEKIYDFDLMMNSGHISGYLIKDNDIILKKLEALVLKQGENPLLFAMGDGNHSLATAKTVWEMTKQNLTEEERKTHPARYALAEIVNIHDSSMEFEPIHRVVFGCDTEKVLAEFKKAEPSMEIGEIEGAVQKIKAVTNKGEITLSFSAPSHTLEVGTLQKFLDNYLLENSGEIDYIHGEDVTKELADKENTIGFILPSMDKSDLFVAIKKDGVLPRKTFSIGEAFEKRFYLECRKIK